MEKPNQIEAMLKLESNQSNSKLAKKSSKSMKKSNSNQRVFYSSFDKQHPTAEIYGTTGGNQLVKLTNETLLASKDYNLHSQVKKKLSNLVCVVKTKQTKIKSNKKKKGF